MGTTGIGPMWSAICRNLGRVPRDVRITGKEVHALNDFYD